MCFILELEAKQICEIFQVQGCYLLSDILILTVLKA